MALAVLVAVSAGACGTTATSPPPAAPLADADSVTAGLRAIEQLFDTPAMRSLAALGPLMTVGPGPVTSVPGVAPTVCAGPRTAHAMWVVGSAANLRGLIPDSLDGRVYVYDGAAYRPGGAGGPLHGVRFMLDDVDSLGALTVPLSVVGWLDLSDGGGDTIRARLQDGGAGGSELVITPTGSQPVFSARLSGTVSGGTHRLSIRDSTAGSGFQVLTAATLTDSIGDLTVRLTVKRTTYDPFDYTSDVDIAFTHGAETVRALGTMDAYCLLPSVGLVVTVNGAGFAAVTNGTAGPLVAGTDRQPLAADQAQAILDLADASQRLARWLGVLFTPIRRLLPPFVASSTMRR